MEISNGYGIYKDKAFRIAHMELNDADMSRLFAARWKRGWPEPALAVLLNPVLSNARSALA